MTRVVFLLVLIGQLSVAQVFSVNSGRWGVKSTWSSGEVPTENDTIVVLENHEVSLNSSLNRCRSLTIEGKLYFSSADKKLQAGSILLQGIGKLQSFTLGEVTCDHLSVEGDNLVEGVSITVNNKLEIKGQLKFIRKSGTIRIKELIIDEKGRWESPDGQEFFIVGDFTNNGVFNSGSGKYHFNAASKLSGKSKLLFHRLVVSGTVVNTDSLQVDERIEGEGEFVNDTGAVLQLSMSSSNMVLSRLNLMATGNTLILSRTGNQVLPNAFNKIYQSVIVGSGSSTLFNKEIQMIKSLWIRTGAKARLEHHKIKFYGEESIIQVDSLGEIEMMHWGIERELLLKTVTNKVFHKRSTFHVVDSNDVQLGLSIEYGSLKIDTDGKCIVRKGLSLKIAGDFSSIAKEGVNINGNQLFIGGTWKTGQVNQLLGSSIHFNGNGYQKIPALNYDTLIVDNSSNNDTVSGYGVYSVKIVKVKQGKFRVGTVDFNYAKICPKGKLIVGGVKVKFMQKLINHGEMVMVSNGAQCTFSNIENHGLINNLSNSNHIVTGDLLNEGNIIGCLGSACTWTITGNLKLQGSGLMKVPRINIDSTSILNNHGRLEVSKEFKKSGKIINQSLAWLKLGMNPDQIEGEIDGFTYERNTIAYGSEGSASPLLLKWVSRNTYYNLELENGHIELGSSIVVKGRLVIKDSVILNCRQFTIRGSKEGSVQMQKYAQLILGDPEHPHGTPFPLNFIKDSCFLSLQSTVRYNSWKDQEISCVPVYGNLMLSDGTGDKNTKFLGGSKKLQIEGDFTLSESSLFCDIADGIVEVGGDWNGPGNVSFSKGEMFIKGNGNSTGEIVMGTSIIHYNGTRDQLIKRGAYYQLRINKFSGHALLKAGKGELRVHDSLSVEAGTMEVLGEKVNITGVTKIRGRLLFKSKVQSKSFNEVLIETEGLWDNKYGVDINLSGDVKVNGAMVNEGGTFTFLKEGEQVIFAEGDAQFHQLDLKNPNVGLVMKGNLFLKDTLWLNGSKLTLHESKLTLEQYGFIIGESNENQITGVKSRIEMMTKIDTGFCNLGGLGMSLKMEEYSGEALLVRHFNEFQVYDKLQLLPLVYEVRMNKEEGVPEYPIVYFKMKVHDYQLNNVAMDEVSLYTMNSFNSVFKHSEGRIDYSQQEITGTINSDTILFTVADKNITVLPVELLNFTAICIRENTGLSWEVASPWEMDYIKLVQKNINNEQQTLQKFHVKKGSSDPVKNSFTTSNIEGGGYFSLYKCLNKDNCTLLKTIHQECDLELKLSISTIQDFLDLIKMNHKMLFEVYDLRGRFLGGTMDVFNGNSTVSMNQILVVNCVVDGKRYCFKLRKTS